LSDSDQPQLDWDDLDADQQTALRVEFGRWLDGLHERGIDYPG
jgi:hypothetical protein